jgi:type II secretory pathway component PulF
MGLILSPGQLAHRAELYHQLAQLVAAGISLTQALERLQRNPPSRSFREPLRRLVENINQGGTFADSLRASSGWLPELDVALFAAGEQSGRLDICFRVLAEYYHERARMLKQAISQLFYPVCLIHAVVFVFLIVVPFAGSRFSASLPVLFLNAALVLMPFYVGTALLIYILQARHGESWRALVESCLRCVPVLGTARYYLALSRLALTLEAMLNAGVNVIQAWELAANACGSPALRRAVIAWKPQVEAGETPATVVTNCSKFPELFADFYRSGELSGSLDDSLQHLHRYYRDEGNRKLQNFAEWTPRILYALVALIIAYKIIQFYGGYFNQISHLVN